MKKLQKVSNVPKKDVFCKRPQKRRVVEIPGNPQKHVSGVFHWRLQYFCLFSRFWTSIAECFGSGIIKLSSPAGCVAARSRKWWKLEMLWFETEKVEMPFDLRKWMKIGSQMITVRFLDTVLLQCHVNSGTSIVASYAQKVSYKAFFSLHRRISIQGKWWEVPSIAIQLPGMLQTATKGEGLPATGFKRFCQKWDLESSILHWFEEKSFPNLESGILDSRGKKCLGRSWILNPLGR